VVRPTENASAAALIRRASFDLNCDRSQLRYQSIDERTQGVMGCGRRATYIETCRTQYGSDCVWVLNGAIDSDTGGPPPAPPEPPEPPGPPSPPAATPPQ
jgi:hypothetical protein